MLEELKEYKLKFCKQCESDFIPTEEDDEFCDDTCSWNYDVEENVTNSVERLKKDLYNHLVEIKDINWERNNIYGNKYKQFEENELTKDNWYTNLLEYLWSNLSTSGNKGLYGISFSWGIQDYIVEYLYENYDDDKLSLEDMCNVKEYHKIIPTFNEDNWYLERYQNGYPAFIFNILKEQLPKIKELLLK